MQQLREGARRTIIERYDLKTVCLPMQRALIERFTPIGSEPLVRA